MHILVQMNFESEAEFKKYCAVMAGADIKVTHTNKDEPKAAPAKNDPAPTPPKDKVPSKPPKEQPKAEPDAEDDGGETDLTFDEVGEKVLEVSKTKGKAAAKRVLAAVGVQRLERDFPEDKYQTLMDACEEELAAE